MHGHVSGGCRPENCRCSQFPRPATTVFREKPKFRIESNYFVIYTYSLITSLARMEKASHLMSATVLLVSMTITEDQSVLRFAEEVDTIDKCLPQSVKRVVLKHPNEQ
jgi:hypothetical protein